MSSFCFFEQSFDRIVPRVLGRSLLDSSVPSCRYRFEKINAIKRKENIRIRLHQNKFFEFVARVTDEKKKKCENWKFLVTYEYITRIHSFLERFEIIVIVGIDASLAIIF